LDTFEGFLKPDRNVMALLLLNYVYQK